MSVDIKNTSRLVFSDLRTINGVEFWSNGDPVVIPVNEDDLQYEVQDHDRLDLIADKFYSNAELAWVIAVANDMRLPTMELKRGQNLRVPSGRYVFGVLLSGRR